MEDYIKKQIDMIGQMLMALAQKFGMYKGELPNFTIQSVQDEVAKNGLDIDIDQILSADNPVSYLGTHCISRMRLWRRLPR